MIVRAIETRAASVAFAHDSLNVPNGCDAHDGFIVWASGAPPRQGFENARPDQR